MEGGHRDRQVARRCKFIHRLEEGMCPAENLSGKPRARALFQTGMVISLAVGSTGGALIKGLPMGTGETLAIPRGPAVEKPCLWGCAMANQPGAIRVWKDGGSPAEPSVW